MIANAIKAGRQKMSPPTKPQFNCGVSPYAVILSYQRRQRRIAVPADQSVTDGGRPLVLWAVASQGHRRLLLGISPSGPELLVGDYGRADGSRHREAVGLMAGPPSTDLVRSSRACMAGAHTKGGITLPYTNTSPNECGNFRFMRKTHAGPPRHSARSVAAAIPGVDRDPLPPTR